ncbi:MAG: hypothetical protein IKD72_06530, partial [Clostridia bacterium]|nr:hypothetical protein [Clostridia bacterium]
TAAASCLQVVLPVSTVQMEYRYHLKDEKMLARIAAQVAAAKALCSDVEFIAQDATRAEESFLIAALRQAKESGATAATLCDDAGIFMPRNSRQRSAQSRPRSICRSTCRSATPSPWPPPTPLPRWPPARTA